MHFKFLIIFILCNVIFCQAQLNRAIGEELLFGSSRSYAMGLTNSTNANNSSLIRSNPSLLKFISKDNKPFFDFQMNINAISERRSILVKDFFGDFLTYADYANNNNSYNYFQGGVITNLNNFIGLGISFLPLTSFNYDYIEEVRGSTDIEDGDIGLKDPLEGYHKFSSKGSLHTVSIGMSYSTVVEKSSQFNLGIGLHQILNTTITDEYGVDTLTSDFENLSLVNDYYSKESFKDLGYFYSLGLSFINNEFLFSLNIEPGLLIQTDNYSSYNFIDSLGIISYLDDSNTNFIVRGLNYYKPEKLCVGLSYSPRDNSDLTMTSEIEYNRLYQHPYLTGSYYTYKFGFEYLLPSKTPIRSGLIYKKAPIELLPDQAIVTFGTGGQYKNTFYDIGCSYTFFDYYYPTLFLVNNQEYSNFDKITDSKLNFIISLRYLFK